MKTASAKAKGRRLQQYVRDTIRERFNLPDEDVRSTSMGAGGLDIRLSSAARAVFPFAIECKNTERINVWQSFAQAEEHSGSEGLAPLLVFKRNRSDVMVAMRFDDLLDLLKQTGGTIQPEEGA